MPVELRRRPACADTVGRLRALGLSALAARVVAGRTPPGADDLNGVIAPSLQWIPPPHSLRDSGRAARRLAEAVTGGEHIGIVTDYDVDGITSHALCLEALVDRFGCRPPSVHSFIGHRLTEGYGLSEPVAQRIVAATPRPGVVITADCGSSDQPRIAALAAAGIDVIVTDHHAVPVDGPPASAYATVNPTRHDCAYPDALVAGCMVMWLLMCLVREQLMAAGHLPDDAPKLGGLLDHVALGTVADAVSLFSSANRAVVRSGLAVLNRRQRPCWQAMATLLDRTPFTIEDLGFQIGPRINARGRMDDAFAALKYLRATSVAEASQQLEKLDRNNLERRATERAMLHRARQSAAPDAADNLPVLLVYDAGFHPGVQGIVASRLVESFGRPAFVLSPGREPGLLSGSGRSIDDLHLRDLLQEVADAEPDLFVAFGGHAGAAGLTLRESDLARFRRRLIDIAATRLDGHSLKPYLWTDGEIAAQELNAATLEGLESLVPYGRGFEAPLFECRLRVREARPVGGDRTHLALRLMDDTGGTHRAIWFRARADDAQPMPVQAGDSARFAFRLARDDYRGGDAVQLIVSEAAEVIGERLFDGAPATTDSLSAQP